MEIKVEIDGARAVFEVEGKLTVQTSPDLEAAIGKTPSNVCDFDIDLSGVSYVSSAGLRVFVATDKLATSRGGLMRLIAPNDEIMEVLEMTGLSEVFTIE